MKKYLLLVISSVVLVSLFLTTGVHAAEAGYYLPPAPDAPGEGSWHYDEDLVGKNVPMDKITTPPPNEWMDLLANGILLETQGSTELCHPFPGAQFGWEGGIYLLNGHSWLEIPSTTAWLPDEEGKLMICADVPMSGTYALFGFCGEDCVITGPMRYTVAVEAVASLPKGNFMVK